VSDPGDGIDGLIVEIRRFVRERDWERFHDPKNLAMAVASEAGELAAELRWVHSDAADAWCQDPENRARLSAEIADVAITLLMLADRAGIDVVRAALDKLGSNARKYPAERVRGTPG
jgi:NTP pyrophosphatase (non-canonical NTP hydrolase)